MLCWYSYIYNDEYFGLYQADTDDYKRLLKKKKVQMSNVYVLEEKKRYLFDGRVGKWKRPIEMSFKEFKRSEYFIDKMYQNLNERRAWNGVF